MDCAGVHDGAPHSVRPVHNALLSAALTVSVCWSLPDVEDTQEVRRAPPLRASVPGQCPPRIVSGPERSCACDARGTSTVFAHPGASQYGGCTATCRHPRPTRAAVRADV